MRLVVIDIGGTENFTGKNFLRVRVAVFRLQKALKHAVLAYACLLHCMKVYVPSQAKQMRAPRSRALF